MASSNQSYLRYLCLRFLCLNFSDGYVCCSRVLHTLASICKGQWSSTTSSSCIKFKSNGWSGLSSIWYTATSSILWVSSWTHKPFYLYKHWADIFHLITCNWVFCVVWCWCRAPDPEEQKLKWIKIFQLQQAVRCFTPLFKLVQSSEKKLVSWIKHKKRSPFIFYFIK